MSRTLSGNPSTVYNKSEGEKFNADTTLVVVECPTCGITYAIPESLQASALRWKGDKLNGWKLCCPLGHTWWYVGETEIQKARRQAQEARTRLLATRELLEHEQRSHAATKGHATRRRKKLERVQAGVCPCCNRSFQNLARHMAGRHPEFKP
jgi:hypothetical protein